MKIVKNIFQILLILILFNSCSEEELQQVPLNLDVDVQAQLQKLSFIKSFENFEKEDVKQGLKLYTAKIKSGSDSPIAFYLLQADRSDKKIQLKTIALSADSNQYQLATVNEMAKNASFSSKIEFAINGDFFYWTGKPWGPFIRDKQILHLQFFDTWHSYFGISADGTYQIGGNLNFTANLDTYVEVLGGVEKLVSNYSMQSHANSEKHPRTAIAFNDQYFYVLVVDGRKPEHSIGMSLRELSELFFSLKAKDALNLDGGGSSTLVRKDAGGFKEINVYSDAQVRAVANGLALVVE